MNKIDESNFILFAAQSYDNPQCMDETEFFDDLKRFKYLKRLFNKYKENGELKERLVLNHLTILYNLFNQGATRMLFFKLRNYLDILIPFLVVLGRLPTKVEGLGIQGRIVYTKDVEVDPYVVDLLRSI
tara:strand:- start:158 stop:544 length:387 start_codon:yes stop_codon:yes gene_type:complete